jgi:hypothetical protein
MSARVGAFLAAAAWLAAFAIVRPTALWASATITVVNLDGPNEGFNDPTPVSPVGGNSGTTLGAQRLIAAQYAADVWGAALDSTVEIKIDVAFNPLPCDATGAVIGSTGPTTVHLNFVNAPRVDTVYPQALANKLAGIDLAPTQDDIGGQFNSSIGTTCALPRSLYYGLDANPGATDIDFVSVALHEYAHGLGFLSFVDAQTGQDISIGGQSFDDVFSLALEDHSACLLYPSMTDQQRAFAAIDTGDLHWVGSTVVGASGSLTAGVAHPSGHVQMYAPNPILPGSSVSHFDTALTPNELMEPSYTGPNHDITLTRDLLLDIGWSGTSPLALGPVCSGGEFQANTTTVGDQLYPSAAFDGTGNSIVVWQSEGIHGIFLPDQPAPTGVFGQRFDSTGNRIGSEIAISNFPPSVAEFNVVPDVAMNGDGSFVVAWGSDGGDVFARQFASDATPLGAEFMVNTFTAGYQGWPVRVRSDQDGNFVVVWFSSSEDDGDPNGGGVFGQRFDAAGNRIGGEFQVNTFTPNYQGQDAIGLAMNPAGDFVVVWDSIGQALPNIFYGESADVYGQRFASDGTRIGGEFLVNTHIEGDEGRLGLDAAMNASGDFVVIWQGPNDGDVFHNMYPLGGILGQRFDSSGTPVGTEFVVNTKAAGLQLEDHVGIAGDGSFAVTWSTDPKFPNDKSQGLDNANQDDLDIEAQRFDSSGAKLGPEFRVNSYTPQTQRFPNIAMRPNGDFLVVWSSRTCEDGTEELCLSSQDGEGWGAFGQLYNVQQPTCAPTPLTGCFSAGKSSLSFGGGRLKWLWRDGPPLNPGHFGQPAAGITSYAFCLYQNGAPSNPVMTATVPAGNLCGGRPCWKATGATGFQYHDNSGANDGVTKIKLKGGAEGKSQVQVQGSGANLSTPALPLNPYTGITAQLVNGNGECWQAAYPPPAKRNNSGGFSTKF